MIPNTIDYVVLSTLVILLSVAAWQDVKQHRISNRIVFVGVFLGFMFNGLIPEGQGFNSPAPGGLGWLAGLTGLGMGMAVLLPFYWLRAMGAGDVKLMGMVGAILGPGQVLGALLGTFLVGGLMALVIALQAGAIMRLIGNVKFMLLDGVVKMSAGQAPTVEDVYQSVGKLPYAVAIAIGTVSYLIWRRLMWVNAIGWW
jgi:prepilin peptidase CpaA